MISNLPEAASAKRQMQQVAISWDPKKNTPLLGKTISIRGIFVSLSQTTNAPRKSTHIRRTPLRFIVAVSYSPATCDRLQPGIFAMFTFSRTESCWRWYRVRLRVSRSDRVQGTISQKFRSSSAPPRSRNIGEQRVGLLVLLLFREKY